jgi:hypothetical protein
MPVCVRLQTTTKPPLPSYFQDILNDLNPEQTLINKFDGYDSLNYYLARVVDGDSPKAFLYSIANFPIWVKP